MELPDDYNKAQDFTLTRGGYIHVTSLVSAIVSHYMVL